MVVCLCLLWYPRSLAQVRSERQDSALCADKDGGSSNEYFSETFDSQGGGVSDGVSWLDWDEEEEGEDKELERKEKDGEGQREKKKDVVKEEEEEGKEKEKEKEEEEGEEEEKEEREGEEEEKEEEEEEKEEEEKEEEVKKVEDEKEEEKREEEAEKETSKRNEGDIDGEMEVQMTTNSLNNVPDVYSTMSATTPQTVLQASTHSDGEDSCVVALVDSPTHSTSSLSEGGNLSLPSSVPRLTPRQEDTPSTAERIGVKKSPLARYHAMAALILGSTSDKSTASETEQPPTLDLMPQSSGPLEAGEVVEEKVDKVKKSSKKKKAKKAVTLAAQFGAPQPQIAMTGTLSLPVLPLPAILNSGGAPKESASTDPALSFATTTSSQGSGKQPATNTHASSNPTTGMRHAAEGGDIGSTSEDGEGGPEGYSGRRQWAKWQSQLAALKVTHSTVSCRCACVHVCVRLSVCHPCAYSSSPRQQLIAAGRSLVLH